MEVVRLNAYRRAGGSGSRSGRGYLSPTCSQTPATPALSVVPLLLVTAASPFSPSSVFTRFDPAWSCRFPFCLLVGRDAEAEAWVASKWRGFATTGRENRIYLKTSG